MEPTKKWIEPIERNRQSLGLAPDTVFKPVGGGGQRIQHLLDIPVESPRICCPEAWPTRRYRNRRQWGTPPWRQTDSNDGAGKAPIGRRCDVLRHALTAAELEGFPCDGTLREGTEGRLPGAVHMPHETAGHAATTPWLRPTAPPSLYRRTEAPKTKGR
ncbi:hypothetical protein HPB47_000427 [Ixodes persulcatus]|uniref:Uncharacterized protein n=1 Tax=Ixodes persulcatus TaxID=34615 RepID=A0AC60PTE4_IXOPE|nr:hypothetical protein HPB47_000427 [Ixodes persulcatus]